MSPESRLLFMTKQSRITKRILHKVFRVVKWKITQRMIWILENVWRSEIDLDKSSQRIYKKYIATPPLSF